jgi:glycosyltransferase involved in cell wall biosynthesis
VHETIAPVQLHLDSPVDGAHIRGAAIHVQGWAHDPDSPVRDVTILLDGVRIAQAMLTWPRPDLAEGFGDPRMALCGFDRVVTPVPALRTPGPHTLVIEARLLDGRSERTSPVRVELPAAPMLDDAHTAPRHIRGGNPLHGVWLARSMDRGGSQLRMAETVEHLARRGGWRTTVLSPTDGPLRDRLERAGAEVRLIDPVPFDDASAYLAAVQGLGRELRVANLAVAATVTSFPLVHAALLAGVPAVQRIGEDAPLPTVVAWLIGHLDQEVEAHARRAIGQARIWTNARSVATEYHAHGYGDRYTVIHTGRPAPAAPLPRAEARRRLGLPEDRRVLVFAGTVWPVKGQGLLTEALRVVRRDHPDLLVAMVGYDQNPYAAHLRDHLLAHAMTDSVVVAPFHDDLSTWWAAGDAVALTPASKSEALSGALVEGMARGLPALATRTGDTEVMVEDGWSGWLAEPDDLGSLVDALRRAGSADLSTWRRYGERAAERCAREDDREGALETVAELLEETARSAVERSA